ncbi:MULTISPECIES: CotD family spore coat protein [Sutcliffiella]|uniref:Spore coat protein CotD n=1 Tax=Sutcliffiella cohnii TaxID=33932 RepID=A0A223KQ75_9BACI|nr:MULTISPECIES: CotD family spore coat protein [Sutcliffiella]AST91632.1 hypothetical protein BC6307_10240 [Sutcliffiella cohnii]MED4014782.1 CotD family spore coat protein [Sutcliffiella cohnii]WBL12849.1 CotD family spore coat protein [Sutcliffiella sp. NC1]
MHHCRPNVMAPIVHPTKCCVKNLHSTTEVPHIHPSHTTYVNNQHFQHKHYYPHTDSMVDSVSHQHFNCGPGGPGMAPMGPGMGGPGAMGPGMGPGMAGPGAMGPGMGPGYGFGR